MLDLTGESQTITVTDTTTYEKEAQPEKPDEAPADDQKADDTDSTDESADTESTDETADSDSTDAGAADETTDESADASDKDAKPDDTKAPEMKTEAIAFSDIKVGDTIKVTLDADGNATAVVVMNAGAPEVKEDAAPADDKKDDASKDDSEAAETTDDSADAE